MKPLRKGRKYYLHARVPKRYHSVDERRMLNLSLHTDSYELAVMKLPLVWAELIAMWELRLAGRDADAQVRYDAAVELAERRGYPHMDLQAVLKLPAADLVGRVAAIPVSPTGQPDLVEGKALLGVTPKPRWTLDDALKDYMDIMRINHKNKSEKQKADIRRRKSATIDKFKIAVGDIPIEDITREDLFTYRNWLAIQIEENEWTPSTATKALSELSSMLKEVFKNKVINVDLNFGGLAFKNIQRQRPPFSDQWIKEKILAPNALDGLNKEARCILLALINTGCRPVEIANLSGSSIFLDAEVPRIIIKGENRELKTVNSERIIPLTGVSLEAFKECPNGFPRYSDDKGGISMVINQYMTRNGLKETEEHSLYSLRHAFFDRMMNTDIKEEFCRTLMGHTKMGMSYGKGAALAKLHSQMAEVAI